MITGGRHDYTFRRHKQIWWLGVLWAQDAVGVVSNRSAEASGLIIEGGSCPNLVTTY